MAYQLSVFPHHIQIKDNCILTGDVKVFDVSDTGLTNETPTHRVRIWTKGGMGINEKEVFFEFNLQTVEKVHQFVMGLLSEAKAPFNLRVDSIKPNLVQVAEDCYQGTIEMPFSSEKCRAEFETMVAPHFFPGFQCKGDGSVLQLTSQAHSSDKEMIEIMKEAFADLNRQTFGLTNELLLRNEDRRFCGSVPKKGPDSVTHERPVAYCVTPEGISKESSYLKAKPYLQETGVFGTATQVDYQQVPLAEPTPYQKTNLEGLRPMVQFYRKIIEIIPSYKESLFPFIERMERILKGELPLNPVDLEQIDNLSHNFPSFENLTVAQEAEIIGLEVDEVQFKKVGTFFVQE